MRSGRLAVGRVGCWKRGDDRSREFAIETQN